MVEEQKPDNEPVVPEGIDAEPGNKEEQVLRKHLSHDGLFRVAFDNKNVAESFARENLPGEITNELDFSSMTQDKDTFVDQKLSRCYSDVLYHIQFKDNPAYLYFLFEHKSWEPDFPGVQLLKNMAHIWEKHVLKHKDTKKLPPIIPLLIYHGEYPWKVDKSFLSMFDIPDALEKYIPSFCYELYDISHMPEEQIKGEVELRIILTAFRYIYHPEVMSRLKNIFQLFRELPGKTEFNRYLELLLIYLGSNIKDVKPDQLRDAVDEALEEGGAMMSTVFQQVREEGKDIGLQEGKEIGVKEGEEKNKLRVAFNCLMKGMDIKTIAEITELPVERIESLKTAVHQEKIEQP
jgi:predicted transposase/invertase (TIGR01784 family)